MNAAMTLLDVGRMLAGFAANWLLQSTLLIGCGLLAARVLKSRGAAVQSVVYRTTLAAVVLCPLAGILLDQAGFNGWSIEMPVAFQYTEGNSDSVADTSENALGVTPADSPGALPVSERPLRSQPNSSTYLADYHGERNGLETATTAPEKRGHTSTWVVSSKAGSAIPVDQNQPEATTMSAEPAPKTVPAQIAVFDIYWFGILSVLLVGIWLLATGVLCGRLFVMSYRLGRIRADAARVSEADVSGCATAAAQLETTVPDVLRSPFLSSPLLHGIRRPAILLPDDESLILQDVFVHELAHLKRRDCFWLLLRQFTTCVFFFQPLMWLLGKRIDASAEEVCDDYVVEFGGDRARYATALVDIASQSLVPAAAAGMAMVSFRSMLGQRVARIMDSSRSLSTNVGRLLLLMVLTAGLVSTTAVAFVGLEGDEKPARTADPQSKASQPDSSGSLPVDPGNPSRASKPASVNPGQRDPDMITGQVVDVSRQGISGAKVWWFRSRVHDIDPMKPLHVATSGENGKFSFKRPLLADPATEPASWDFQESLVVQADGYAVLRSWPKAHGGFHVMEPEGEPLRGRIVDIDGQPVVGATLRIRRFERQNSRGGFGRFAESLFSSAQDSSESKPIAEWRDAVRDLISIIEPVPQRFAYPSATTNENGEFELSGIGQDWMMHLLLEGKGIQSSDVLVCTALEETLTIPSERGSTVQPEKLYGNGLLFAVGPSKSVFGSVTDLDTGEPIIGAVVRAYSLHGRNLHSSRELQHLATRTDKDGRYTISGLPIGKDNSLVTFTTDGTVPWFPASQGADTSVDERVEVNFGLRAGVWAEGRVTDGRTAEPYTGEISYHWFRDRSFEKRHPGIRGQFLDGVYWTNINGEFRIPVLPTRGILAYRWDGAPPKDVMAPRPIDKFPRGLGADEIEGRDPRMNWYPTMPTFMHPGNFNFVREINPAADAKKVRADMALRASKPIDIQVTSDTGVDLPASGFLVYGLNERWGWQSDQKPNCVVVDLLPGEKRKVLVYHREAGLGGAAFVHEGIEQPVKISLVKTGRVKGRVFERNGDLVDNGSISVAYEKLQSDEKYAIWASHPTKRAMPAVIPIDEEGYFELDGLIPGWKYSARVNAPRKMSGRMTDAIIGMAFLDLEVEPGESKDLGDIKVILPDRDQPEDQKPEEEAPVVRPADAAAISHTDADSTDGVTLLNGRVLDSASEPVPQAMVKLTAVSKSDFEARVIETVRTGNDGRFSLKTNDLSAATHQYSSILVRHPEKGIGWCDIAADRPSIDAPIQLRFERPVRGRFVDVDGQPVAGINLQVKAVFSKTERGHDPEDGVNTEHVEDLRTTSDQDGRFIVPGIPDGFAGYLEVSGNDQIAPQSILINSGMSPERGRFDATYRDIVVNVEAEEEALITLAPAQIVEGTIRREDTGKPVANAKVSIWSSQQEFGSMMSVNGMTDEHGKYRVSANPGIRVGIRVFAPAGMPYMSVGPGPGEAIDWKAGDRVRDLSLNLPRGVLVTGRVTDAATGEPVSGASVQYRPESANNPHTESRVMTGWLGRQVTDKDGRYQVAVFPGPGRILVSLKDSKYIPQVIGSRKIVRNMPGGTRYRVHAVRRIDPDVGAEQQTVDLTLTPGETARGTIVTNDGKTPESVLMLSPLKFDSMSLMWRGHSAPIRSGHFQLAGMKPEHRYPTYFLDPKSRQGAIAMLAASAEETTVMLQPCGTATARFITDEGEPAVNSGFGALFFMMTEGPHPVMDQPKDGQLAADADYAGNVDSRNHQLHQTDENGVAEFPALIPGATYELRVNGADGKLKKRFVAKSGETIELGEYVVKE